MAIRTFFKEWQHTMTNETMSPEEADRLDRLQRAKAVVRDHLGRFDIASDTELEQILAADCPADYHWRGMHPFLEQHGPADVASVFWLPFRQSFAYLQRRMDIFFAGANGIDGGKSDWVVNAGHFMGRFDRHWLGIPATGKAIMIRYAEFHQIAEGKIVQTALFLDILSVMYQAGVYPLPPMTAAPLINPSPRTQDGLLFGPHDPQERLKTAELIDRLVFKLNELNLTGVDRCPPAAMAEFWTDDMGWYGPCGIGSTFTIKAFQEQHQYPFREGLTDKVYNGHIARFAEGTYAGFFGWPNLKNRNKGGFLGLPASDIHAPMRVVDLYRRDGDKLAENWVYIDLLHYLNEQGLDVLARMKSVRPR